MSRNRCKPAGGVSLIEALIAMVVTGGGLMVLTTTQMKLVHSADVARQRGEATRLATERIESARAYSSISGAGDSSWNSLASGTETAGANLSYTRSWTLDGNSSQPMRQINVAVAWTDRSGAAQSVAMSSVISRTDPLDVGSLGFPLPANGTIKRPKNRNLNIPVPAVDLGNGKSVSQVSSGLAVVYANDTGAVEKTCGFVVNNTADLGNCSAANGYVLAGYISLSGPNSFPSGLAMNTANLSGSTGVSCALSNAIDQNSNATISGMKYYLCLVRVASAGNAWSGSMRLAGMATGTDYLVCRFQYPSATGVSANQRNVQPYSGVAQSLGTQNYVISSASSCPTVDALATALHQTCRSSNASRASDCPAS